MAPQFSSVLWSYLSKLGNCLTAAPLNSFTRRAVYQTSHSNGWCVCVSIPVASPLMAQWGEHTSKIIHRVGINLQALKCNCSKRANVYGVESDHNYWAFVNELAASCSAWLFPHDERERGEGAASALLVTLQAPHGHGRLWI